MGINLPEMATMEPSATFWCKQHITDLFRELKLKSKTNKNIKTLGKFYSICINTAKTEKRESEVDTNGQHRAHSVKGLKFCIWMKFWFSWPWLMQIIKHFCWSEKPIMYSFCSILGLQKGGGHFCPKAH